MSVTLETKIESIVSNYPTIDDFRNAISSAYGTDSKALLNSGETSGDIEQPVSSTLEEVDGKYIMIITSVWKDQTTLDAYLADPFIADEKSLVESTFTVTRTTL